MVKKIKAFECDFCERIFLTERGAKQHERRCRKNPCIARACYTCVHYENVQTTSDMDKFQFTVNGLNMHLDKNRCRALSTFLFNPHRWKDDWVIFLNKQNSPKWKAMPSAGCGCEKYEQIDYGKTPSYPTSHQSKTITTNNLEGVLRLTPYLPLITKHCNRANEYQKIVALLLKLVEVKGILDLDATDIVNLCQKGGEIHATEMSADLTKENWGELLKKEFNDKKNNLKRCNHALVYLLFPENHPPTMEDLALFKKCLDLLPDKLEVKFGVAVEENAENSLLQILFLGQYFKIKKTKFMD